MKEVAKEEGCELKQLGNTEVFYCPEHTGNEDMPNEGGKDKDLNDMITYRNG